MNTRLRAIFAVLAIAGSSSAYAHGEEGLVFISLILAGVIGVIVVVVAAIVGSIRRAAYGIGGSLLGLLLWWLSAAIVIDGLGHRSQLGDALVFSVMPLLLPLIGLAMGLRYPKHRRQMPDPLVESDARKDSARGSS